MKKYIDAEQLQHAIDKIYDEWCGDSTGLEVSEEAAALGAADCVLEEIYDVINSLQQEQRETDGDDGKFVKILVRKEFAEQIQRLGDEILAGQSSFVGAMNQQEQLEIDLEKEIDSEWKKCNPIDEGMGVESAYIHIEAFDMIARHFYELGYNARK